MTPKEYDWLIEGYNKFNGSEKEVIEGPAAIAMARQIFGGGKK